MNTLSSITQAGVVPPKEPNMTTTAEATTPRLDRLRRLVEIVEKVPERHFDMTCWREDTECGAVGCAIGHYAMSAGSRLKVTDSGSLRRGSLDNWDAVEAEFNLSYEDSQKLFYSGRYINPSKANVLARVRQFIADHEPGSTAA